MPALRAAEELGFGLIPCPGLDSPEIGFLMAAFGALCIHFRQVLRHIRFHNRNLILRALHSVRYLG